MKAEKCSFYHIHLTRAETETAIRQYAEHKMLVKGWDFTGLKLEDYDPQGSDDKGAFLMYLIETPIVNEG